MSKTFQLSDFDFPAIIKIYDRNGKLVFVTESEKPLIEIHKLKSEIRFEKYELIKQKSKEKRENEILKIILKNRPIHNEFLPQNNLLVCVNEKEKTNNFRKIQKVMFQNSNSKFIEFRGKIYFDNRKVEIKSQTDFPIAEDANL